MPSSIRDNYSLLKARIADVCGRCGRDPEEIRIIWVSKTQPKEKILEALSAGAFEFGENKAQEVLEKFPLEDAGKEYRLHFIGRLQSNKVRKIIPACSSIQSVDSLDLLERINRICGEMGVTRDIFFQVNTSAESSKTGFSPEGFLDVLDEMPQYSHLRFKGLMTIGPFTSDLNAVRTAFRDLADLLKRIKRDFSSKNRALREMKLLSMGMSDDFEVAIEEGSHYIRIGTSLFGSRRGTL
ncbi:YggS family pyridoxal phosphate-dependent enzyme [Fibrobacterota bacterium]